METSSSPGKIHISAPTAKLLIEAGASDWVQDRPEKVIIAGKGAMETYFLETKQESRVRADKAPGGKISRMPTYSSTDDDSLASVVSDTEAANELEDLRGMSKFDRLIDWNVEMLSDLLKQIIAARDPTFIRPDLSTSEKKIGSHGTVLAECKDIIALPKIGYKELRVRQDPESIELPHEVVDQLRHFISIVCDNYFDNPFHNFEVSQRRLLV